jgi:hypothetical protein
LIRDAFAEILDRMDEVVAPGPAAQLMEQGLDGKLGRLLRG